MGGVKTPLAPFLSRGAGHDPLREVLLLLRAAVTIPCKSPARVPTVDVLATVEWNTLTYMYKRSSIKLFFKGYHGMLPSTLAEELIIHGGRPSSRLKHRLIAPRFSSKYVQNSISYRGAVLWNAIGRSNRSIIECTNLNSFLKNVVNCRTFKDFNFNVLAPQIINKRS